MKKSETAVNTQFNRAKALAVIPLDIAFSLLIYIALTAFSGNENFVISTVFVTAFALLIALLSNFLPRYSISLVAVASLSAVIFHKAFLRGSTAYLGAFSKIIAQRNNKIFTEISAVSTAFEQIFFAVVTITIAAVAYSALPKKAKIVFVIFCAIAGSTFTESSFTLTAVVIILALLSMTSSLPAAQKLPFYALFIILSGAVLLSEFPQKATNSDISSSAKSLFSQAYQRLFHDPSKVEIEIVMESPQPLYLRETVSGESSDNDFDSLSKTFSQLYDADFYPAFQLSNAFEKGEESYIFVNVKSGSPINLPVPVGAVSAENLSADHKSLWGDFLDSSDDHYCKFTVASYPTADSLPTQSTPAEAVYRSLVCDEFLTLSDKEKAIISDTFEENDNNLSAILDYISTNITPTESGEINGNFPTDNSDFLTAVTQTEKSGNETDYALLTALLARYCGIPSRLCTGYLLDSEAAGAMSAGSAVTLTAENRHIWAEIYCGALGWIPFETHPDYAEFTDFDFLNSAVESISDSLSDTAEANSTQSAEMSDSSPTADENPDSADISDTHTLSPKTIFLWFAGISVLILLAVYTVRALLLKCRINSRKVRIKSLSAHRAGCRLVEISHGEKNVAEQAQSEEICLKMLYSKDGITIEEAHKCVDFYHCAQWEYRKKTSPPKRFLNCICRGIR